MEVPKDMPLPIKKEYPPKTYLSPKLVEYGSLQHLTHAVGEKGSMDGGSVAGEKKTSV